MDNSVEKGLKLLSEENYEDALDILFPYAESGDLEAQAVVGLLYHLGLGIERDVNLAITWLEKAAKQGSGDAAHNLGTLYLTCEVDRPIDKEKSKYWFNRAKKLGFKVSDDRWYVC